MGEFIESAVKVVYNFFWGDIITIPLPGGGSIGFSLLVLILVPAGIFFTFRTKFVQFRCLPDMFKITAEKKNSGDKNSISGFQTLIVSTATRVGMGNLVGVVAAISAGGAGAIFWMWIIAILGSATAFVESTLAQIYKEEDPIYGGYRGGPAYYLHAMFTKITKRKKSVVAVLFAVSGLVCWGGVSQVIGNSVSSSFDTAFSIPPLYSTIALVAVAAVIVLRKKATVKVLDIIVPIMAVVYFVITIVIIVINIKNLPAVFERIFAEAFGIRQAVGGGIGAVIMTGAKRGLFSNEAGSGSAPCAAAAADVDMSAKAGILQSFGVYIDTLVICTCTAMIILLTPESLTGSLEGMPLLLSAMEYHLGSFGSIFISVVLWLFSFSTFLGILFYARPNVAYAFGDNNWSQTMYKIFGLLMLFIGGISSYSVVWDIGDIGVAFLTVLNMIALFPMAKETVKALDDYKKKKKDD